LESESENLKNGFILAGFSQGGNIARYIL